ncbi:uncharacterized protein LOC131051518 [Cryptomeria japonica]|uniref:uncharacterized protein LOC131051518 n=1 Tax=Cryptomeria japonica TaxID=3369 RepID=UPI0025AD9624|nr:uncharacterized protein LOC131051518 [Cryptomeria japonica]
MASCSTSTPVCYFPPSSVGATARTRPAVQSASISLQGRSYKKGLSLSIMPTRLFSPKPGFAYLVARAATSKETSTDVSNKLEELPVREELPEENSLNASKQLEELPVREELPEENSSNLSKQFEVLSVGEVQEDNSSDVTEQFDNIFIDLKRKFDSIEDKPTVLIYGGAAVVALLVTTAVVDAIESVPLFPKAMEFVGFGYTVWFVYRYLLFKKSREELAATIEELKQKITG